tara:strand:- start:317 stop:1189 length:873 start_codon:yes stop_codon:yes gene_type:complete
MTKERILILGHDGYIGSHLVAALQKNFPSGEIEGLSYPELDLTNCESSADKLKGLIGSNTTVIMCSGIKKQHGDNIEIYDKNMAMVVTMCLLMEEVKVKRFVYFSSAEVYGEAVHDTNISEKTQVQPSSYYGIAKYASEGLLRKTFSNSDQGSLLILRPALIYGPKEAGSFYGPTGFLRTALKGEPITLWGDGAEKREFVYIEDLVQAVVNLTSHEYSGVINIVGGESYQFSDILEIIKEIVPSTDTQSRPRTKSSVDQGYDNSLLREVLPKLTFTRLDEGIAKIHEMER